MENFEKNALHRISQIVQNSKNKHINKVTDKTKIVGIIGHPIGHVMSPKMHNAAFEDLNMNWEYIPFDVKPVELKSAVQQLRNLQIQGFNVTIPHKISIIPFLDQLDPIAAKIGAVNTVKNDNGFLIGKNTDGAGCLKSYHDKGIIVNGKKVVIIGAGGAARAISFYFSKETSQITIINRSASHMDSLISDLRKNNDISLQGISYDGISIEESFLAKESLKAADILINTTPIGMYPQEPQSPIPKDWLHSD
ncbi:MAG: shikimate dehydrogenase family protein, partial [Promethearchaeota archaeon]